MASQNLKRGGNAVIYSALAIGILILINIVSSQKFGRLDLTEEQRFTLSDASKKLVATLPDRLTVKAFISSDLPPQVSSIARYLRDMLEEYATYSQGKMVWESLDPSKDEKIKDEARRLKVQEARLSVYQKTKASVTSTFLGVAFQYGGKVESLPFVSDVSNLEYLISSTIRRLTTKQKKVGFTTGHGEPSTSKGLAAAGKALEAHQIITVDLKEGKKPIPEDVDVLVMVGPTQRLAERAKYELDQFLMKGKALAILVDGMVLQTPRGQFMPGQAPPRIAQANVTGLRDQLAYYGVKLNEDLVMDQQNARVMLPVGNQRIITNYPAFPIIKNLSKESPITRKLKAFVPIFPSSLELTPEVKEGKHGVKGTVLASCSDLSWRQTGFFLFNPLQQPTPTKERGPFDLAVFLQGSFKSFFDGKPVPAPGPAAPPSEKKLAPSGKGQPGPDTARLVVVSDSDFIKDQNFRIYPENMLLLQNIVDVLAEDESLIAIRAKTQTRRPLQEPDESTVTIAKYGNIIGLPLAFILFGLLRWRWRKIQQRRRAQQLIS